MKAISPALLAHLMGGNTFIMADLYTIYLVSGETLRYADCDQDISWNDTFRHDGAALARGATRVVIGTEVDTLDVTLYPRDTDTLNGESMQAAATFGAFDGARFKLERAFLNPDGSVIGAVHLFSGKVADQDVGRTEIQLRVNSDLDVLSVQMPRNLYQPQCMHTLYDNDCGLQKANFGVSATVMGGSDALNIAFNDTKAAGYFNLGYVQFDTGALAGVRRTIKSHSAGLLSLLTRLPATPAAGDTFKAYPGCDRAQGTCSGKFQNILNFRATPFVPIPETAF